MSEFPLQAIIFDVDGTLAETEELHRRAFNEVFVEAGLDWVWDRALYARLLEVTGGKERIAHYMSTLDRPPTLNSDAIAALHAAKTKVYSGLVQSGGLDLRPGVKTLITEAEQASVRLAIATTTSRQNVDALLEATLGRNPFEVIAAGDEVPAKKPAPDVYRLALQRLSLVADRCVAVEDTLNGLRSAASAGVPCLVTMSVYGGAGPFPGALAIVESLQPAGTPPVDLDGLRALHARRFGR